MPRAFLHLDRRHLLASALLLALACAGPSGREQELVVTATAYTSHPGQTIGDPTLAAWGDRLHPDTRAIAVSEDLLALGLTRGTRVEIEGLPGTWRVLDKMSSRWRRRIDVYMGMDREAARHWGRRRVRITWRTPGEEAGDEACRLARRCR